jgi:dTDP-4-dehydrorhamnose reductase
VKLLLLGRNGQVGRALSPILPQLGDVVALGRDDVDFEDSGELAARIRREEPDVIVNAAAYTAVDAAEDDSDHAFRVNADAVRVIGEAARGIAAFVVHYSTDFVFDGTSSAPYRESDRPQPLGVYGASKLAGEIALRDSGAVHMVLRLSWVYSAGGRNFPLSILHLARSRDRLDVVADEIGAPTSSLLVADATNAAVRQIIANRGLGGLYHLAPGGAVSRHELAQFIVAEAIAAGAELTLTPEAIHPIAASAWPSKVRRPANSVLDTARFRGTFGVHLPPWQDGIRRLIKALRAGGRL